MKYSTHPIEPEEVMAYLDGELEAARATVVAAHLDQCAECQSVAAALKAVSCEMLAWEVDPAPASLLSRVTQSARVQGDEKPPSKPGPFSALARLWFANRWVWGAGAFAILLLGCFLALPDFFRLKQASWSQNQIATEAIRFPYLAKLPAGDRVAPAPPPPDGRKALAGAYDGGLTGKNGERVQGPMVARTASLTIVARDFSGTRAAVERIVSAHHGYLANLNLTNQKDSPQSLSGTLQIPADELAAALAELRALGRVEQESQSGEEISANYLDLLARLKNSRETEKRLAEILQQRTGKLADVLSVEQEIARVRGEIEEMESQQKQMEHRVQFTSITLQLTEDFKASLGVPSSISLSRLRNALADGFHAAAESFFGFIEFLLNIGPALFLWAFLLFWPARYAWRHLRRHATKNTPTTAA